VVDPRLERVARESRETPEADNIVVSLFRSNQEQDDWVEVRMVVAKSSGRIFVIVKNPAAPMALELTRKVEAAVVSALRNEFPANEIRVDDQTVGPRCPPTRRRADTGGDGIVRLVQPRLCGQEQLNSLSPAARAPASR